jgi:hypothetical protein
MSYRDRIGTHYANDMDDTRLRFFVRDSRIPHGYFDRNRISPDAWVVIACVAIGAFLLLAGVIG